MIDILVLVEKITIYETYTDLTACFDGLCRDISVDDFLNKKIQLVFLPSNPYLDDKPRFFTGRMVNAVNAGGKAYLTFSFDYNSDEFQNLVGYPFRLIITKK